MVKKYKSEKRTSQTEKKLEHNQFKIHTRNSSTKTKLRSRYTKKDIIMKKDIDIDNYNSFIGPSIAELINALDQPLKNNSIPFYNSSFKLKFPSKIHKRKFIELFKNGIDFAKSTFKSDNLKKLKEILLILKDINGKNPENEFGLMTCKNELQKTYRIDLILTLLSDEKKIE